jgi:hypothetical protein
MKVLLAVGGGIAAHSGLVSSDAVPYWGLSGSFHLT